MKSNSMKLIVKRCLFFVFILFLLLLDMDLSWGLNRNFKQKIYYFGHLGSLSGIGMGIGAKWGGPLRTEFLLGAAAPFFIGLTAPYVDNQINLLARVPVDLRYGFYIAPGWYLGYYDIMGSTSSRDEYYNSSFIQIHKTLFEKGPLLSGGFYYPNGLKKRAIGIEGGVVWGIHKKMIYYETNYKGSFLLTAARSLDNLPVFPFMQIWIKF